MEFFTYSKLVYSHNYVIYTAGNNLYRKMEMSDNRAELSIHEFFVLMLAMERFLPTLLQYIEKGEAGAKDFIDNVLGHDKGCTKEDCHTNGEAMEMLKSFSLNAAKVHLTLMQVVNANLSELREKLGSIVSEKVH